MIVNAMFPGMFHPELINGGICWKYVGSNYFERKQRIIARSFHLNRSIYVHIANFNHALIVALISCFCSELFGNITRLSMTH